VEPHSCTVRTPPLKENSDLVELTKRLCSKE
jgi:hypothetical protein